MKTSTKNLIMTQKGQVSKNIANALSRCRFNEAERKIYTGYYNGRGKWATRGSSQGIVLSILESQGYSYKVDNDAPQGGITGDYVKVSKTAFEFLRNI